MEFLPLIQPSIQDYLTSLIIFTAFSMVVLPLLPAVFSVVSFLEKLPHTVCSYRFNQEVAILEATDYQTLLRNARNLGLPLTSRKKADVIYALASHSMQFA